MFNSRTRARAALFALCAMLVISLGLTGSVGAAPADYSVTGGWFYTQTGGGQGNGYSILDAGTDTSGQTIRFWTEFKRLGGLETLGYPVGQSYTGADGFVYQPFQRGVLQWRPELGRSFLANTFEQLQNAGKDNWLFDAKGLPAPIVNDGSGGDYATARATRLGWLTNSAIQSKFLANPNPGAISGWNIERSIEMYGLPMSRPEQHGPFISQRFQRVAFQLWTEDVAGMPAKGSVVGILGGDLMKEAGLLPAGAIIPLGPGGSAPVATPVPTATATPVAPAWGWHSTTVQGFPNCGTTYLRGYVRDAGGNGVNGMAIKSWNDWGNEHVAGSRNYQNSDGYWDRLIGSGIRAGKWYVALVDGSGNIASDTVTINFTDSCASGGVQQIEIEFKQGGWSAATPVASQPTATPVPQSGGGDFYWRISNQQGFSNCGTTYFRGWVRDSAGNGVNGMAIRSWNDWGNVNTIGSRNYMGTDGYFDRVLKAGGPQAGRWYVALVDGNGVISSQTAVLDFNDNCTSGVQQIDLEIKPR